VPKKNQSEVPDPHLVRAVVLVSRTTTTNVELSSFMHRRNGHKMAFGKWQWDTQPLELCSQVRYQSAAKTGCLASREVVNIHKSAVTAGRHGGVGGHARARLHRARRGAPRRELFSASRRAGGRRVGGIGATLVGVWWSRRGVMGRLLDSPDADGRCQSQCPVPPPQSWWRSLP